LGKDRHPHADGRLRSQPAEVGRAWERGIHELDAGVGAPVLLMVPEPPASGQLDLLVFFHGAGADGRQSLDLVAAVAARHHVAVLAPTSEGRTWDVLLSGLGPDVAVVDQALAGACAGLDVRSVGVGGFSDGASYALTIGLANGDRFSSILAFSPGFAMPPTEVGRPLVFVSHGTDDRVLPIDVTSRRVVQQLRAAGHDVTYQEFGGGHGVPPDVAEAGLQILSRSR
jgi:phospholipase/carboxylesterase